MPTLSELLDKAFEGGLDSVPMEERWKDDSLFDGAERSYDDGDPRKVTADILKKNDGGK